SIEADKAALGRHVDLAGDVALPLQRGEAAFKPIAKRISQSDKPDVAIGIQCLGRRAGAAPAAADKADLERIASRGVYGGQAGQRQRRGTGGGGFEEVAAPGDCGREVGGSMFQFSTPWGRGGEVRR